MTGDAPRKEPGRISRAPITVTSEDNTSSKKGRALPMILLKNVARNAEEPKRIFRVQTECGWMG